MEDLHAKFKELFNKDVPNNKKNDLEWITSKIEEAESTPEETTEEAESTPEGNYIMKVTHLAWGKNNKNHFYADKKPLINAKVMKGYASQLKIWLKNGWIEKGSYK